MALTITCKCIALRFYLLCFKFNLSDLLAKVYHNCLLYVYMSLSIDIKLHVCTKLATYELL